jgi:hypothetical protein
MPRRHTRHGTRDRGSLAGRNEMRLVGLPSGVEPSIHLRADRGSSRTDELNVLTTLAASCCLYRGQKRSLDVSTLVQEPMASTRIVAVFVAVLIVVMTIALTEPVLRSTAAICS